MLRTPDLFSGIGGFSLGLRWAGGFETVGFCEVDRFCRQVLAKHWPDVPIHDDVGTLNGDEFGPVDVVCGGFPCQPWSVAGRQRGAEDDRDLWPEMHRVIRAARPRWVIGENVRGIVGQPMGLPRVSSDLEALGYSVAAFLIPACAVGAPHRRERVWIVAHANQLERSEQQPARELPKSQHDTGAMADTGHGYVTERSRPSRCVEKQQTPVGARPGGLSGLGNASGSGLSTRQQRRKPDKPERGVSSGSAIAEPSGPSGWADAEWLECSDTNIRRIKPGLGLLVNGFPNRVAKLRALGNAVVPQIVQQIGEAILTAESEGA